MIDPQLAIFGELLRILNVEDNNAYNSFGSMLGFHYNNNFYCLMFHLDRTEIWNEDMTIFETFDISDPLFDVNMVSDWVKTNNDPSKGLRPEILRRVSNG